MRWDEFAHAVRAAAGILGEREVVVIGSQAIHAAFDEDELPKAALASMEIDIAALDDPDETKSGIRWSTHLRRRLPVPCGGSIALCGSDVRPGV